MDFIITDEEFENSLRINETVSKEQIIIISSECTNDKNYFQLALKPKNDVFELKSLAPGQKSRFDILL